MPFGLARDPKDKHKLRVDPEAAEVVREIFEAAIGGMRLVEIARMLNGRDMKPLPSISGGSTRIRKTSEIHQIRPAGITILSEIS